MSARDTFTDTGTSGRPRSRQPCRMEAASSQMYWSSRVIKPLRSKRGMNFPGARRPSVGWFQRTSASAPQMRLVFRLNFGWK